MNANDLFKAAMQLDLEPIKAKLMHAESGEGWSRAKADAVEKEYRRFLCLMKLYPDEPTAPLVDVDTFWHYHILDTQKYAADCDTMFGYFLHHYPYIGLRGEGDEQVRLESGDRMKDLYEATFGEAYPAAAALLDDHAAATSYCGGPYPKKPGFVIKGITLGTAYCGGPYPKKPEGPGIAIGAATAYCGGPYPKKPEGTAIVIGKDTAYCGGPYPKKPEGAAIALNAATAYCGGPYPKKPAAEAATAKQGPTIH